MADDGDATLERLDALAASLRDVAASVERQREDLHLALEVLIQVAAAVDRVPTALATQPGNGLEVGAVMGATQAAWLRLEQRLDGEFSELQRQLHALQTLQTLADQPPALAGPGRSGTSLEQLRKAAGSLRATVSSFRRQP